MIRTKFLSAASMLSAAAVSASQAVAEPTSSPAATTTPRAASRFFREVSMNYVFQIVLGAAYFGVGDVGTVLAMIDQVEDGNAGSAYTALTAYAARARAAADAAFAHGHRVTARECYLQAASYDYAATYFCDPMGKSELFFPTWQRSRAAMDTAFSLFSVPPERVSIPYAGTTLSGYFFRVDDSGKRRPLVIMNNGSDGSPLDMWVQGGASALARGYNFMTFDGPGQGAALWIQHLSFRPDWEKVVTPVLDFMLARPDVDPRRVALQGISQGGYWVPRAAAFDHRLSAIVADPGVLDVATSWFAHLPPPLIQLFRSGNKDTFNKYIMSGTPAQRGDLIFRMRPYGLATPFDVFTAVQQYTLNGLIDKIRCPTFVCDPADEQFWPGQSQDFYDRLSAPKLLVDFTVAEGANWHCEPMAPGLRSQRVYDWLDTTLEHSV